MTSKKAINKYQKRLGRNEPLAPPSNVPQQTLALLPHEIAFAEWLVTCPKRPKIAEQMAVLMEKAAEADWQGVVTKNYLHNLKHQRKAFQEFSAELMRDHLAAARAKYKARLPEYIEADYKGMKMALDREDYKALPAYTKPAVDRAMPKQEEQQIVAVKIELTERQMREINEDEIIVEGELIDDDP